ncbi:MAG: DUF521 domain-containing protein [Acidobacteria bacterium]|nr:MAG: DUF521 domain-containing protein [Acidobacteriota bacterium]
MSLHLRDDERAMLAGEAGEGTALAMRIVARMAEVCGAGELLAIESAHVDGCLYHGPSGLDFAQRLVDGGARVRVPTTLNVGALDLLHPGHFRGAPEVAERARRLMAAYVELGCQPTWTCAPYQYVQRPPRGSQIAWAESNAIVFANSVLGARSERYGDFIDVCAAITGRVPAAGLHLQENRRGEILFRLRGVGENLLHADVLGPVLGYLVGERSGRRIPVIEGLPAGISEDVLKALGAAAASSGAVALFHAAGITPEAPTLEAAFGGRRPRAVVDVTPQLLRAARDRLATTADGAIDVVALGSPHFSIAEFARLLPLVEAHPPRPEVEFVVCTHRVAVAWLERHGHLATLAELGVEVVADTCVVVTPILRAKTGTLMTNSGKFAHYAPGNVGLEVVFGSLEECVRSAHHGRVWRDPELWR